METAASYGVMIVAILLVVTILLQVKGGGAGLFGGGGTTFRTRRGVEKTLFQLTIALAVVFVVLAIINLEVS